MNAPTFRPEQILVARSRAMLLGNHSVHLTRELAESVDHLLGLVSVLLDEHQRSLPHPVDGCELCTRAAAALTGVAS